MPNTLSRGTAVVLATVLLMLVTLGGFFQLTSTDAAWSDEQIASGSFQTGQVTSSIEKIYCRRDNSPQPHNWIHLSWDTPQDLQGHDVVYEVSWQDATFTDYTGHVTTEDTKFGPFFPGPEFTQHHADIRFTIYARVADSNWQSPPSEYSVKGPVGAGVLRCR